MFYAHTLTGRPKAEWEPLAKHLTEVAERAATFADAFDAGAWGKLLGDWHDLGKYSGAFQKRLDPADPDASEDERSPGRVDHSTYGARHAAMTLTPHAGQVVAFCIAGHHGGLPDATSDDVSRQRSTLSHRLDPARYTRVEPVDVAVAPPPPLRLPFRPNNDGFDVAFFTRMLFSCLVDADRTA